MARVTWADGVVTEAPDWEALIDVVGALPWNRHVTDVRNELARRAYVWSGEVVDPTLPAERLWLELERAGLVQIDWSVA